MAEKKSEQSSFTVTDRRLFTPDGELRTDVSEEKEAKEVSKATASPTAAPATDEEPTPAAETASEAPDREMPVPPASAEQEAQEAAYRQSSRDLDSEVERAGQSV